MTTVWIMRKNKDTTGERSVLVRADAITYLSANEHQVRTTELGSDNITLLADVSDGGPNAPLLPEGFNVDLLFAISSARRDARDATDDPDEEDRVLMAQLEEGDWVWKTFRPSGPEPKAS
ncbi:hypothetical protein [Streptomyces fildesensis]|uniref:hypothetical protein n=1 Tax=Streptomyces fildesensis TaxID=375757 RepID=UPI0018DF341F|nr:hypothetical protein [Streptomyces fildesensis]